MLTGGCNHSKKQGWLWVAVTPLVAIFEIALSRGSDIAKNLLGKDFGGILNSEPICSLQLGQLRTTAIMLGTFKT